jgi:hypothetical protein
MESRFVKTQQLKEVRRGALKYKRKKDSVVVSSEMWFDRATVENKLFTQSPLDSEITLRFLDMPALHCY